jgi:hypothetical protein
MPDKGGKGVVATRKIARGEILMTDFPALMLESQFLTDVAAHHRRRLVRKGISQLPEATQEKLFALWKKQGNYLIDDILAPNSITVKVDEKDHMGLFLDFSVRYLDRWTSGI